MNQTYRTLFNESLGAWVAVPETATGKGKRSRGCKAKALGAAMAAILGLTSPVYALDASTLPTGATVSAGSASMAASGHTMTVNQASNRLAIDWQSFNIGSAATVNFVQPSASAIALNRVLGSDPSQIYGKLNANGQVFLLNPNGILFAKGAEVNVGGLVASTLSLSDADFLTGNYRFTGAAGSVTNEGTILAADKGYVALLGGQVSNRGAISAKLGNVSLAAGSDVTLDFAGDGLIGVQVNKGALNALAENKQLVQADGGTVLMTAKAADSLIKAVVNNEGVIEARTVDTSSGTIKLLADMDNGIVKVGGTLDASAPSDGNGGFIETSAQQVKVVDNAKVTTLAANGRTGTWLVDPYDFTIAASGGDITGTTLANALASNDVTIQTSKSAATCTNATCGTGNASGKGDIFVNDAISWSSSKTLTLNAYRNININAAISASASASTGTLKLYYGQGNGGGNYTLASGVKVDLSAGNHFYTKLGSGGSEIAWTVITDLGSAGSTSGTDLQGISGRLDGRYVLGADIDASATSTWNSNGSGGYYGFNPIGTLVGDKSFEGSFDGLNHAISNLAINRSSSDYVGLFGFNYKSFITNVRLIGGSISGGSYVGALIGFNYGSGISNSYASSTVQGNSLVGGLVGENAASLTNSSATGTVSGKDHVGGLVGGNDPYTISNCYATGQVTGSGSWTGGLAGINNGTIDNSYAIGSVTGGAFDTGGLVGENFSITSDATSTITRSYATGTVSGGAEVGGLVGLNFGATIDDSYATGNVKGSGNNVGGLVGENSLHSTGQAIIRHSYATGTVSGTGDFGGLVGLNDQSTISDAYWDVTTSRNGLTAVGDRTGGTITNVKGYTTAELAAALPVGFDSAVWGNANNQTTPYLLSHSVFDTAGPVYLGKDSSATPATYGVILNVNQLQAMGNNLAGNFVLGNDIDASATSGWNSGAGFAPIGSSSFSFKGVFDGLYHSISNLSINRSLSDNVGLFGDSLGGIYNVGLNAVSIRGRNFVAGLVANNNGTISGSYVTGSVSGAKIVGGLAGNNASGSSSITDSYATSTVSGNEAVGGLVGNNANDIDNSYAAGSISGVTYFGGLVGYNSSGGTVSGGYFDTDAASVDACGHNSTGSTCGTTGLTETGMKTYSNFSGGGWSISNTGGSSSVWRIYDGDSHPLLRGFLTSLTVTAKSGSKTYDGTVAGLGATYSTAYDSSLLLGTLSTSTSSKNVGSYAVTPSGLYSGQQGYDISYVSGSLSIAKADLTLSSEGVSKVYDGTTSASGKAKVTGGRLYDTDTISGGRFAYSDKNAGTKKTVTVSGVTVADGNGGGNYNVSYVNNTSSTIGKATLSLTGVTASDKTYDGTTAATLSNAGTLTGLVSGEDLAFNTGGVTATFSDKNAGVGKTVTATGYSLADGTNGQSSNYTLTTTPVTTTATINKADATVTANSGSATYNGNTQSVAGFTANGLVAGETESVLSGLTETGGSGRNAGSYAHSVSGTDGNYNLTFAPGTFVIAKAPLTVTANNAMKTYDGIAYSGSNGVHYSGFVNGEGDGVLSGSLIYGGSAQGAANAGNYTITPSGLTSGNYDIAFVNGVLTIVAVSPVPVMPTTLFSQTDAYRAAVISADNPKSTPSSFVEGAPLVADGVSPQTERVGLVAHNGEPFLYIIDGGMRLPAGLSAEPGLSFVSRE